MCVVWCYENTSQLPSHNCLCQKTAECCSSSRDLIINAVDFLPVSASVWLDIFRAGHTLGWLSRMSLLWTAEEGICIYWMQFLSAKRLWCHRCVSLKCVDRLFYPVVVRWVCLALLCVRFSLPYLRGEQPKKTDCSVLRPFYIGLVCIPNVTKVTLLLMRVWQTVTSFIVISYIASEAVAYKPPVCPYLVCVIIVKWSSSGLVLDLIASENLSQCCSK